MKTLPLTTHFNFMSVRVVDAEGNERNEEFFLGRLPNIGEAVEMVLVRVEDGEMAFQLRVVEK